MGGPSAAWNDDDRAVRLREGATRARRARAFALPEWERTDADIRLREFRDRTRPQVTFEDAKIGDDDDVISSGSRELS